MGKGCSSKSSSLKHEARTARYDSVEKHEFSNLPYARSLADWMAEHGRKHVEGPNGRLTLREQRVRELIWPSETRLTDRQLRWVWEYEQPYCHFIAPYAFTPRKRPYKEYLWIQSLAEASATSKGASSTLSNPADSTISATKAKSCVSSTKLKSRVSSSKSKLYNAKDARSPELIRSEPPKHKDYGLQQSCDTSSHQIKQEEDTNDADVVELDQQKWTNDRFRKLERAYMMTEMANREQALLIGQLVSQVNNIQQQNWLRMAHSDPSTRAMHPSCHNSNGEVDVSAVSPYALSNPIYQLPPHLSPAAAVPWEGQHTVRHGLPLQHPMHQPSAHQPSTYQTPTHHHPTSHVSIRQTPTLEPQVLPSPTQLPPGDRTPSEPSLTAQPLVSDQFLREGTGKRKKSLCGESEPSRRVGNKKRKLKDNRRLSQEPSSGESKHEQSYETEREILEIADDQTEIKTKKGKKAKKSRAIDLSSSSSPGTRDALPVSAPHGHMSALAPSVPMNGSARKFSSVQKPTTSAHEPLIGKCSLESSSVKRPIVEKTTTHKSFVEKGSRKPKCGPDNESERRSARTLSRGEASPPPPRPLVEDIRPSRHPKYPSGPAQRTSMYITLWGNHRSDKVIMAALLKWLGEKFSRSAVLRTGFANREFYVIRFPTLESLSAGTRLLSQTRSSFSCHGKPVKIDFGPYNGLEAHYDPCRRENNDRRKYESAHR